jgi:hypothetical protein
MSGQGNCSLHSSLQFLIFMCVATGTQQQNGGPVEGIYYEIGNQILLEDFENPWKALRAVSTPVIVL